MRRHYVSAIKCNLPMLKKYPELVIAPEDTKVGPSDKTLKMLLQYSKSIEVKRTKKQKMIVHLN
jgi:hypothetical protein